MKIRHGGFTGFAVLLLAAIFTFAGCSDGGGDGGDDITYTVQQAGGVAGESGAVPTASSTHIKLTFSAAVEDLDQSEVAIAGAASGSGAPAADNGNKKVWLIPITVSGSGTAAVSVNQDGIESGQKTVTVYKQGEAVPTAWSVTADGKTNTASTKLTFTFAGDVSGLTAGDITLSGGTGAAAKGALSGGGKTWNLAITPSAAGTITVRITKTGIDPFGQTVTVYTAKPGGNGGITSWTAADTDSIPDGTATRPAQFSGAAWGGPAGSEKFVAVGDRTSLGGQTTGIIAYSSDGATWTAASLSPFPSANSYINGVAWGGGKFVAVGYNGTITYSPDGVNWTNVTTFSGSLSRVAWGGPAGSEKFVAVGLDGIITYSQDGVNWTEVTSPLTGDIDALAWGSGKWVAADNDGNMTYSTDGINWTPAAGGPFDSINALAWGSGKWVAANSGSIIGSDLAYSTDGTSWTKVIDSTFFGTSSVIYALAWGGGKWVASGDNGTIGRMAYSSDGVTWTAANSILDNPFSGLSVSLNGLAYGGTAGNKRFVVVGGDISSVRIWYSSVQE